MLCSSSEVWWEGAAAAAQGQHGRHRAAVSQLGLSPQVGKHGPVQGGNLDRKAGREADGRLVAVQAAFWGGKEGEVGIGSLCCCIASSRGGAPAAARGLHQRGLGRGRNSTVPCPVSTKNGLKSDRLLKRGF